MIEPERSCPSLAQFPTAVECLPAGEKKVAMIVYCRGSVYAKDVDGLVPSISLGSIRTVLKRLVAKGILKRRKSGRHKSYLYIPAIPAAMTVESALQTLAEDHFGGSLPRAALAMMDLLESSSDPESRGRS